MMQLEEELLHISALAFEPYNKCLDHSLKYVKPYKKIMPEIEKRASKYISDIRKSKKLGGVEEFIVQFGLKEKEAIGLLCLAEALLRIPDKKTVDDLISDKLKHADWKKFISANSTFSIHAKSWALMTSSSLANLEDSKNPIEFVIHKLSEPAIRIALKAAMQILGKEFVAGETIEKAIKRSKIESDKGYSFSYDMLGEGARNEEQAQGYLHDYLSAITALKDFKTGESFFEKPNISVKLSALHARYLLTQRETVLDVVYERAKQIMLLAQKHNITISIDAEESYRLDIELELFAKLIRDPELKDFHGFGFVVQAYQKRAVHVIDFLQKLAKENQKKISIRLVKGAYWDSEIKWSQMEGCEGYPVFTYKNYSDVNYLACAAKLLKSTRYFYPQFATHNALTAAAIVVLAEELNQENAYEFQRLYGMGNAFFDEMISERPCRIYAPVGRFKNLLPYLIRRLMENGANSNFINQLLDEKIKINSLLKNPIDTTKASLKKGDRNIPLPINIFSNRPNSTGYSLGNRHHLSLIESAKKEFAAKKYVASPNGCENRKDRESLKITAPYHLDEKVGEVILANQDDLLQSVQNAKNAATSWRTTHIVQRAEILEKTAVLIKENEFEFFSLLAKEAGKTLADAIAEVREAIDFCNYYAMQARELAAGELNQSYTGEENHLTHHGKGIFACISPWNFPLAIFAGQIAAALVAGNAVIAKPAESTSLIAQLAVDLFIKAGIPKDILQFMPSYGKLFGEVVLSSNEISGVAFTGSTPTAHIINRSLAARNAPIAKLIAETGGQNAMIVDSSALLEQACDDILISAFSSAGQRCSALRVLYVQDEVADDLIGLLKGGLDLLEVGDPNKLSCDVGPVIDKRAKDGLDAHISHMKDTSVLIAQGNVKAEDAANGHFVVPHIFEIKNMNALEKENFGPILHIVRFKSKNLDKVIAEINSANYGLTFGIHSRIQQKINHINSHIRAGNIYINRNITGAVVGVQPFGGMMLSGTGPKAGGPEYLKAFMTEQNISNNVTAIGGNLGLLT